MSRKEYKKLKHIDPKADHRKKLTWTLIDKLGKSNIGKTSYIFVLVVPIIVKLFENLQYPVSIDVGGYDLKLNMELPFKWYILYFGGIFIALGSVLYQIYCPRLIKNFKNFGDFVEAGESDFYLFQTAREVEVPEKIIARVEGNTPYIEEAVMVDAFNNVLPKSVNIGQNPTATKKVLNYQVNSKYLEDRKDLFNKTFHRSNRYRKYVKFITISLYAIGLSMILFSIFKNLLYVISVL